MPPSGTLIFRASLGPKLYRDVEIADTSTLYALAETIIASFDFSFDHAFGFYDKLKGNIYDSRLRYELFADMGEAQEGARSVKRTRVAEAFPADGSKLSLLFDYGDEWHFLVARIKRKPREAKVRLPRVLVSAGTAPPQYPDIEDE